MTDAVDLMAALAVAGPSESPSVKLSVGARLAQARVAQGFSLEQIAGHLKWTPRQIAEIEASNYAVFSDMASVRGFVRSYAKYLKVDPTPLFAELAGEAQKHPVKAIDRPQLDMPFSDGRLPWLGKAHHNTQKIAAIVSLVFLCLLALFVYRTEVLALVGVVLPAKNSQSIESGQAVAAQAPHQIEVRANAGPDSTALVAAENTVVQRAALSAQPPVIVAEPVSPAAQVAVAVPVKTQTVSAPLPVTVPVIAPVTTPANMLVLKFKQDSWLQIRNGNGAVMIARVFKAGSEQTIDVTEPMALVIGNAPGVDVRLRGESVALPAQIGSNVVTLNIK